MSSPATFSAGFHAGVSSRPAHTPDGIRARAQRNDAPDRITPIERCILAVSIVIVLAGCVAVAAPDWVLDSLSGLSSHVLR